MRTKFTLIAFAIFSILCSQSRAQLNYLPAGFSTSVGTYTDIDLVGTPIPVANVDDAFSAPLPIGFTFNFNGAAYDSFVFSTNGFIKLGNIAPSRQYLFTTFAQPPANGPFTSTTLPTPLASDSSMLFAFGTDLFGDSMSNHYTYAVDGTFGSRVCTIQWKNVKDKFQNATVGLYDTINFQVRLYEGANIVEYVYGPWTTTIVAPVVRFAAVGIVGKSVTTLDQNLHLVKGSTVGWGSTVATTGFYANNAVNYRNGISSPAGPDPENGRMFTFVPLALNDAAVNVVYAQGKIALPFYQPEPIMANISNPGINTLTSVAVTLDITGANTYSNTVIIPSLAPNASVNVSFPAYMPLDTGASLITVSVPFDDNVLNNQKTYSMSVGNHNMAYFDTLSPVSGSNGITIPNFWGCKYFVSGKAIVKQVKSFLVINADATGDTVCALVMDTTGKVIARSPNYIVQASDAGTTMVFNLPIPPYVENQNIICGIAGGTSVNGLNYFLGTSQTETPIRTPNPFYFMTQTTGNGVTNVKVGDVWAVPGITGNQATRLMMETVVDQVPDIDIQISNAGPVQGLKVPVGTNIPLRAVIKNLGLMPTSDTVAVWYSVNGGAPVGPEYFTSSIGLSDTGSVLFSGTMAMNFASTGTYNVKIYSNIPNDGISGNDTFFVSYEAVSSTAIPYRIDNGIATNWTIQNVNHTGLLAGVTATQANGVVASNVLRANNISALNNAEARALSPVFNFSSLAHPVLHFNVSHAPNTFVGTDDTLEVQVSTDGGLSFSTVYSRSSQLSSPRLGTTVASSLSFTPSFADQWRYEAVDLASWAGNPFVIVAFRFKAQGGNNVYVGNVSITEAAATSIQPVFSASSFALGNATLLLLTTGATFGDLTFAEYNQTPYSNASPVYATNTTATTNNVSIFTPNNVSNNSWYAIAYSGIGTDNVDTNVTYYIMYETIGVNGITSMDSLYLMRRNNYSSPWTALSTTISGSTLTAGPIYGFGDFTIGSISSANALPVKWLNVTAQSVNSLSNKIGWATASENNTDYFVVERSVDGKNFEEVGKVKASTDSRTTKVYSMIDELEKAMTVTYYYRIKQVDKDGAFEWSKTVQLNPVKRDIEISMANPFADYPSVNIRQVDRAQEVKFEMIDITGKVVFQQNTHLSNGDQTFAFKELSSLKPGVYFMKVTVGAGDSIVKKIVKSGLN